MQAAAVRPRCRTLPSWSAGCISRPALTLSLRAGILMPGPYCSFDLHVTFLASGVGMWDPCFTFCEDDWVSVI